MEVRDVSGVLASSFADSLVDHLTKLHRKSPLTKLVVVAPPSFLGLLRQKMKGELGHVPTSEIAKHLSELPVADLQNALIQNLA